MLNINTLTDMIKTPFEKYLKEALDKAYATTFTEPSELQEKACKKFAETAVDICAQPIAEAIAGAIDYYVNSISIYGTIITTGGCFSQVAVINSPMYATNGKVPNSLGIM